MKTATQRTVPDNARDHKLTNAQKTLVFSLLSLESELRRYTTSYINVTADAQRDLYSASNADLYSKLMRETSKDIRKARDKLGL